MPISTRSSKEELLFVSDPTRLERSIRKEKRSPSIDNNTSSSIDTRQPQSTETPSSSTDTRPPTSTEATLLSTDISHPTSIDTSPRRSIDTEQRDMVAMISLVRDENEDLHDQEGHLCNAAGQKIDGERTTILEPSATTEDAQVSRKRTLAELIRPGELYINRSAIRVPLEVPRFPVHPKHLIHVREHPYCGLPHENPMDHIEKLEDYASGIQKNEATKDYIICKLFEFSLSGDAKNWLKRLLPGSLTTWNGVKKAFINEFFDEERADEIRDKIWTFSQGPTETFRSSWERFTGYQKECPHHDFTEFQLLKKFHKGINLHYRLMMDTASNGNFETRTIEEAKRLIENMASSNSVKNLDHQRIKAAMDSDKIVEADIGLAHEVSWVQQATYQDEDAIEFMLEMILKEQQELSARFNLQSDFLCKEWNERCETIDTFILDTQIHQVAEDVEEEALFQEKSTVHQNTVHPVTVHPDTIHPDTEHMVDSILDNEFGEVLEQEKLEEDAFQVESSMSIGSSYWCRPTPTPENRSTSSSEHRPTQPDTHRSTPLLGSDKSVRI